MPCCMNLSTEYFTNGNDETNNDVSIGEDEMRTFSQIKLIVIHVHVITHGLDEYSQP